MKNKNNMKATLYYFLSSFYEEDPNNMKATHPPSKCCFCQAFISVINA